MNEKLFDINNFNIIQDSENYYFFRALNMADNNDIEQQLTVSEDGTIERIRTDRERFDGETKYKEDSENSLEEMYDHIKVRYRKDTNCISLTSNGNIAINYGRGSYKDKYIMVKIPKKEFGNNLVVAGQYMLKELYLRIQQAVDKLEEDKKQEILSIFEDIEKVNESKELKDIIAKRYTAKNGEVDTSKSYLRKGIVYSSPQARISSYQSLNEEQLLEANKVYAKLAILENENILKYVIPNSSNSRLRETIGNAFSSAEVIHYKDIKQENIIEVSKEIVDIFALIQQVDNIDKNKIEELKQAVLVALQSGKTIPQMPEIEEEVKKIISIEEMYELTEGKVEYGKADSIVKNMFYLSKSRKNAIILSNILTDILGEDSDFEDIIDYIRENGFRIEPEIITRKSGKGIKLSESVNLDLQKEEIQLVDEIKNLSLEELEIVLQNGGLNDIRDIITRTFNNVKDDEVIDKTRYYAEAIISQYNWQDIGIEEFKIFERNELIKRLQERNCVEIYEKLKESRIVESQIPTALLNIAMREGFYEQYKNGNLEELLNTRQDILQNNINIEIVERFLGYYDVENTGIKLKDYQQRACDNIDKIYEDKKFAQVILPTGGGKSFVALAQIKKYAEEHPNEKILYLAPQEEILNQIKTYIVKYIHGNQGTVGKSLDELVTKVFPNIKFETYSGLLAKRGQEIIKEYYGMMVLDELHRTGAKEWEGQIDKLLENQAEDVKVLGITATPTRDADGRDMANETAKKLGYTDEEIKQRKHLASNMTLENAIRMGYVVNPKLVYCKYDLISSGKMDELRLMIDDIEDETKKAKELQKYNDLREKLNKEIDEEIGKEVRKKLEEEARRNLDSGIGKEEILKQNVKKGGKYLVFIPVTDQGDIEDEEGNRIGLKTGEDKIKAYQDYLNEIFKGTDIVPQCHAMSGAWNGKEKNKLGQDKNQQELNAFESDDSEETKFMIVMNKANEGLHIDGVDGIIWFRALDENSRILYLQQLGRVIFALDEDNPLLYEKRPIVIDLANNSLTVKMEKEFENIQSIDDLESLTILLEWINDHDRNLPNQNSTNKQEQHYYSILRRIQNNYKKYLEGFDEYEELTEEDKTRIEEIIDLASEIDLWSIDLPLILINNENQKEINPFEITGILRDFIELEDEIENIEKKTIYEQVIEFLEIHDGNFMKSGIILNGKKLRVSEMTPEQKKEIQLYKRWLNSKERYILEEYVGRPIEEVPEEYREKIFTLREYGQGIKEKEVYEEVVEFLEIHNGRIMQSDFSKNGKKLKRREMTQEQIKEANLCQRWRKTKEKEILEEYEGKPIEEVPEEYREKIVTLRGYGLGIKEKSIYERVVEFLEKHGGKLMRSQVYKNDRRLKNNELNQDEKAEVKLYDRWRKSKEKLILEEYVGRPIEEVPEEYREKISTLREFGLGIKEKTTYEQVLEFLRAHGRVMQGQFTKKGKVLKREEMTKEQIEEINLSKRWRYAKENLILEEYVGRPIEEVPEEYREKILILRGFGLGLKEETVYKQVMEFLVMHNGKLMKSAFTENGKNLKIEEMTEEQREEVRLWKRWRYAKENQILEEYVERPIEEIPEEYREKIAALRKFGLGMKEKTVYEQVMEFLETHDGNLMKGTFSENGRNLKREEMAVEQKEEVKLYDRWRKTKEKEILEEYVGRPIEEVPEEYREKIAKLREFGLGMKKSRLLQAKQERDNAKEKNEKVKELEKEMTEELQKRGSIHEETIN